MEDTTQATQENGEDTTAATQGNVEDTESATQGNDVADGPKKYERQELTKVEDGGKKKSVGKGSRKGLRERKGSAPALPEGFIQKPDGRLRCIFCKKNSCSSIYAAILHVQQKKHCKSLARRQEFNADMVECVEDTTPAMQENDIAVSSGFTLADNTRFRCIVCDVVCSSRESAERHVRVKKHREQKLVMALRDKK